MSGSARSDSDSTSPPLSASDAEEHHVRRSAVAPVLVLLGAVLLLAGFATPVMVFIDGQFGFERVVAAALGFLFLYVAFAARELARLRGRLLDLMEEVLKIFYGPNFRQEREAIDILVRAMASENDDVRRSSREHLVRLTGHDLGHEASAWSNWWSEHRSHFRSPQAGGKPS